MYQDKINYENGGMMGDFEWHNLLYLFIKYSNYIPFLLRVIKYM